MSTLADAGPLVALIDQGQGDLHRTCVAVLPSLSVPLLTTWPCFTEAMYFLGDLKAWQAQAALWGFVERGALTIHLPTDAETRRMKVLMQKYEDIPMDLADASLLAAAETQRLRRIFALDSDFRVYRRNGTDAFEAVP